MRIISVMQESSYFTYFPNVFARNLAKKVEFENTYRALKIFLILNLLLKNV